MKEIIKVLYVVSTLKKSGPTNQLFGIIKNLDRNIFSPCILTLSSETSDTRYNDFLTEGVEIHTLGLSRHNPILLNNKRITRLLDFINTDIIHTCGIRADYLATKYFKNYKHCNTIRNYVFDDYPATYGLIAGRLIAKKHISIYKQLKYCVGCSHAISQMLSEKHNISTYVIQNGVDIDVYKIPSNEKKLELRKKLGLPIGKLLFITVGCLSSLKDPIITIKAFKKANISNFASLIILGQGPLFKECSEIKDDSILLYGNVTNVNEYLQACDVFISASHSEGLPNAVLEAMASGLPVLLSDIQPHKEVIEKNTRVGKLFKVGDLDDMHFNISLFLKYNISQMGLEARKLVEEYFSFKIMSQKYQEFYKKIVS